LLNRSPEHASVSSAPASESFLPAPTASVSRQVDLELDDENDWDNDRRIRIKATNVYRSQNSITNHVYNYYFIDDSELDQHFVLFINSINDNCKVSDIGVNLNDYLPLNSEIKSNELLIELKNKLLNRIVQISYGSNAIGQIIKYISI
jgi:hypothetical protein